MAENILIFCVVNDFYTSLFLLENAYLLSVFTERPHQGVYKISYRRLGPHSDMIKNGDFIYENGGFRKRFPEWRLLKTQVYRFSVGGKNGAFQKRLCHNSLCKPRQYRWRYWYMRIEQKNVRAEPGQWSQKRIFGSSCGRSKPQCERLKRQCGRSKPQCGRSKRQCGRRAFYQFSGNQKRISVHRALVNEVYKILTDKYIVYSIRSLFKMSFYR